MSSILNSSSFCSSPSSDNENSSFYEYVENSGSNENSNSNSNSNSDSESNSSYSKSSKGTINEKKRYKNSIKKYNFFIDDINSDENYYLYNKKLDKFYKVTSVNKDSSNKRNFTIIVEEFIPKNKNEKEDEKENEDSEEENKKSENEESEEEKRKKKKRGKRNNSTKLTRKKKKGKNEKEIKREKEKEKEKIEINQNNYEEYSSYHPIKVYYINYMNKNIQLNFLVNINSDFEDFCSNFESVNHIPSTIEIVYRNKKITSPSNYKFSPDEYDYEKDYIIVIELKSTNEINIKTNLNTKYENCPKGNIPHIIIPKENVKIEIIKVPPQFQSINIDIYQTNLNLVHFYVNKQKKIAQNFLAGNWKNEVNLMQNILCSNSKYKTYDCKEFVISQDLYLKSGIVYVFDINIPATHVKVNHKKIYVCDYANFITQKDKMFIIGYFGKSVSDFSFMNK